MGDGSHILDASDLKTGIVQCADRALSARTRTLDIDIKVFDAVFLCGLSGTISCHLGSERGTFPGTPKTRPTGGGPGKGISLPISDRHDRVVEGSVDVGNPISDLTLYLLFDIACRFSH